MLDLLLNKYDQVLPTSDYSIKTCDDHMNDLSDKQNLCSLIKVPACCKNPTKPTCTDLELTNSPKIFYN